jgi:hypothetical protein
MINFNLPSSANERERLVKEEDDYLWEEVCKQNISEDIEILNQNGLDSLSEEDAEVWGRDIQIIGRILREEDKNQEILDFKVR